MEMENVFYVPGQRWVIDFAIVLADGATVTQQQGHTLEEVQARCPGAILTTYQEAVEQIETCCKTVPRQIDADHFDYALNVLPPMRWVSGGDTESFLMSERTIGRVTGIYARIGNTYWTFEDVCTLLHAEIIAKVRKAQESQRDAAVTEIVASD
ncbi:hypothetical protein QMK50_27060 [Pseudomonas sp. P5_152]|uniref:hypothetical protein n=1 Tax=Pseudomonas sp. P5_152 TaxID=3043442 RepID=UPI002A36E84E|nr:hypothetical protein [Pseudomonas sp. P5_152]MDX9668609.1 hypothetical protein [Pseudomonas sp. P5_152]